MTVTDALRELLDEKHHPVVFRASERLRLRISELEGCVGCLEAQLASARDAALEEAAIEAEDPRDGNERIAARIRALKSKPAQGHTRGCMDATSGSGEPCVCGPHEVLCEHGAGEGVERSTCHPLTEMASEENDLLPKKRRREHEYGEEKPAMFGTTVAYCTHNSCMAIRVKARKGGHTWFRQAPAEELTDEPGPCEVDP
jgi:hypothetical protein